MSRDTQNPYILGQIAANDEANGDKVTCPFDKGTFEYEEYQRGRKAYNEMCGL